MLYGNLIFIKKTGGDGSKFPVTEKDIKIGRSEDCLIRIYNPQVAPEHCQLIIEDSGKAKLRNLSNQTVLNGKPLGQGDTTLSHGDVFKIGARSARWEYLPSSNNYKQPLSPSGQSGRLVAVVMPQQRSSGDQATPGKSASQVSILKGTPVGKRLYSERASEGSPVVKIRKSGGSDLISKSKGDLLKLLTSRHSLKSTKLLLHGAKLKERKSTSGIASTKTPLGKAKAKSRKSTLPSWKVNLVSSPERKSLGSGNSFTKSVRKSTKSPRGAVKTPLKSTVESKAEKLLLSASKNDIKTPPRTLLESKSQEAVKKSILKTPLKTIIESPSKGEALVKSTRSVSKSPSPKKRIIKSPSKAVFSTPRQKRPKLSMPVHSEGRVSSVGKRRMRLMLHKVDSPFSSVQYHGKSSNIEPLPVAETTAQSSPKSNLASSVTQTPRKSVKSTPVKKTPGKTSKGSPRRDSVKKCGRSPSEIKKKSPRKSVAVNTPKSVTIKTSKTPKESAQSSPADLDDAPSAKKRKYTPRKSDSSATTPAMIKSVGETYTTTPKVSAAQHIPSSVDLKNDHTAISQRSRKSSVSKTPSRTSSKASASPRGVRRKLSPTSNAERAAKKLKTSSPKKPDKNKKAALLVLGIASRKQLLSQNVKVLLKRKIVKKAIKQSTAGAALKDGSKKKTAAKASRNKISKSTKKTAKNKTPVKKSPAKSPVKKASPPKSPVKESTPAATPKNKKVVEMSQLNTSVQSNLSFPVEKSPSKQNKKSETGLSILSKSYASATPSPSHSFEQSPESYLFASNRRCSKRLSSKSEADRPDFIELCPTALGLIPKNVEVFKTPKVNKRRSLSLATPKNAQTAGIIKSASTSKITNRKSVRFSSKDISNSEMYSPNIAESSHDFTSFQTPDVTVDVFVSPLTDKASSTKSESAVKKEETSKTSSTKSRRSNSVPAKCVRKLLQSPQPEKSLPSQKILSRSSRITASQSPSPAKVVMQSGSASKGNLNDIEGVRQLFATPKVQKSPKNSLSDLKGVAKLLRTPVEVKSPKNDLTNVKGVKKLFQTPKQQKSPRNDLTDVRGVKKLLKTPKQQKSPKNDLTDVRGVKKLLRTPKVQKSPKNDLSDLRGVKKLLQSPKVQKSPKNDLSNVAGVKQLLRTPRLQKSPKNELSDLRGVKNLLGSPKVQRSPKNDLSDLTGVQKLLTTPRTQKSPKNNLLDVSGIDKLFESPAIRKLSRNSTEGTKEQTMSFKSESLTNATGVRQLLISKSPESGSKNKKSVSRKSRVNDFRAIRGRRTIYTTPKGPKNDLSDVTGVRELFFRHKPICNFDINLAGVAELFELPKSVEDKTQKTSKSEGETVSEVAQETSRAVRSKKESKTVSAKETKTVTRSARLRKAPIKEPAKKATSTKKSKDVDTKAKKPAKRKAVEEAKTTQTKRVGTKKARETTKAEVKTNSKTRKRTESTENVTEEVKSSRKRKAQNETSETSPPKLRRKAATVEKSSVAKSGSTRGVSSEAVSKKKTTVRSAKKAPAKAKAPSKVQSKTATKTGTKQVQKVQSRSQITSKKKVSESGEKVSPRKTRSVKVKASAKSKVSKAASEGKKPVKSVARQKASPIVKRTTRRK